MSFNRRVALLVLAALIAASLACGSSNTTPPTAVPVQQEQPAQVEQPTQAPPTQAPQTDNNDAAPQPPETDVRKNSDVGSGSTLDVVNNTDLTVCYLYISPTDSDQWGSDWLGEYVLDPGYTYTVEVSTGTYDILVTDCNDNTIEEHYGETLGDQPRTWTLIGSSGGNVAGGGSNTSADFTIYNESNIDICWLWVSPSTDTEWGSEWLGDRFVLSPGYYFTEHVQSGYYDLLALDCNNNVAFEEYGIIMGDQPRDYYLQN